MCKRLPNRHFCGAPIRSNCTPFLPCDEMAQQMLLGAFDYQFRCLSMDASFDVATNVFWNFCNLKIGRIHNVSFVSLAVPHDSHVCYRIQWFNSDDPFEKFRQSFYNLRSLGTHDRKDRRPADPGRCAKGDWKRSLRLTTHPTVDHQILGIANEPSFEGVRKNLVEVLVDASGSQATRDDVFYSAINEDRIAPFYNARFER